MKSSKTWFITGASQGIGLELAKQAIEKGHNVIATTRNIARLKTALQTSNGELLAVDMDITNETSVAMAVRNGIDQFGKIDYLVNNAGYGLLGGIEESSRGEVQANFDINVFGLLNVIRAALPHMRENSSGHIINLSSVFGLIAGAGWGIYCATKFAVEGLSEALEQEVSPFGIKVTIIEPGYFRTNFLESGSLITPVNAIEAYGEIAEIKRKHQSEIPGTQPGDPAKAAAVILETVALENPPLRLLLGSDAVNYALYKTDLLKAGIESNKNISISTDYAVAEK